MKAIYLIAKIALGMVIFSAILILVGLFIADQADSADPLLKFIGIVISWPVALTIILLVFLFRFRGAVDHFLRNIRSLNFPGGTVSVQSQSVEAEGPEERKSELIPLTAQQAEEIAEFIQNLQQQHALADETKRDLETKLEQAYYLATTWKFGYLTLFFVPNTKRVIRWFYEEGEQTRSIFHQCWQNVISDSNEREAILEVAIANGVLVSEGNSVKITQHGYSFLQYIGIVPYQPAPGV